MAEGVDAEVGHRQRSVIDDGAFSRRCELTDAVDRVVVVNRQQQAPASLEGIRLAHELQRPGRIQGEDRGLYSPVPLKKASTVARVRSTSCVVSVELGFAECGLPNTCSLSRFARAPGLARSA